MDATKIQQPPQLQADIPRDWFKVIRRAMQASRTQDGLSILSMVVLVDNQGRPRLWSAPEVTKLEPKKDITVEWLLDELTPEQLNIVLNFINQKA